MNLITQKKLAAKVLKVGVNRVWIDPARVEDVSRAITRDDIRHFISNGAIVVEEKKGNSRGRFRARDAQKKKGRSRGYGRRTGKKSARTPRKKAWISKVRALRDELKKLQGEKKLQKGAYRKAYRKIKGNLYHSRRHLRENLGIKQ